MAVKFKSIDFKTRTATFDVNGDLKTRPIAQEVTNETLEEHLTALAEGLKIEFPEEACVLSDCKIAEGTEF